MMRALTIRQPWAWAIARGGKDVENRTWRTTYRGLIAIHAGARWEEAGATDRRVMAAAVRDRDDNGCYDPPLRGEFEFPGGNLSRLLPDPERFPLSAIIAVADLHDIVRDSTSDWAIPGQWHWLLRDVRPLAEPVPCIGARGVWEIGPQAAGVLRQVNA